LEFLARTTRQEQEIRDSNRKGRVQITLFADDMVVYLNDLKNTKKLLEIINSWQSSKIKD
jgi:hypothetical protein